MKKGYYDINICSSIGGAWRLHSIFNVTCKRDEKLLEELKVSLVKSGHFVSVDYDSVFNEFYEKNK